MRVLACFVVAAVIWIPSLQLWFRGDAPAVAIAAPSQPALRAQNPEWELMTRMFTASALANRALAKPANKAEQLRAIDRIIDQTIADVDRDGHRSFLLPYGQSADFSDREVTGNLFVEGELAMMLASRQLVERDPARDALATTWVDRAVRRIEHGPALLGESYPHEAWVFCNTVALAATRIHDVAEGQPARHADLFRRWVAKAKATIVDPATGLLGSKIEYSGEVLEGPEGSTIWLVASMLRFVDDDFAKDQYARAKRELRGGFAGFGWAREWPASWPGREDIDSGPTVPLVGANAGSSGLAIVAAHAFGDADYERELLRSLDLAAFPITKDGVTTYAAGNALADAVIGYALANGPILDRAGAQ